MGRAQVGVHGNKASLSLTYSGVHDISVKRVYFCIRPMPRNRLFFFFFILENSESRNLDGFLFLEFLWVFYQTSKFYQHIDPEKMFLTLSQNFAKVHGVYSSCSRVSIMPISLSPGRTSSRGSWVWGTEMNDAVVFNGVGCHALLQGIFQTQGLNPGLPHCRWILYHLGHQGNPNGNVHTHKGTGM